MFLTLSYSTWSSLLWAPGKFAPSTLPGRIECNRIRVFCQICLEISRSPALSTQTDSNLAKPEPRGQTFKSASGLKIWFLTSSCKTFVKRLQHNMFLTPNASLPPRAAVSARCASQEWWSKGEGRCEGWRPKKSQRWNDETRNDGDPKVEF